MRLPLSISCTLVTATILAFVPASLADKAPAAVVTVSQAAPYAENSGVADVVKNECQLDTRLPEFIRDFAKDDPKVVLTADPLEKAGGRVLVLQISSVTGLSGGAWSGPKSVVVKGELKEGGKVIGSFTAARFSTGGAFAVLKGTCTIFGRCIKTLGQDIAGWLKKPTMNARLGNA